MKDQLHSLSRVLVTKGKKLLEFDPKRDAEEILAVAIGRSGNLRAPALRHEGVLVVGFSEEAYQEICCA